jgi:cysteinyl-tRNA synthetase
VDASETVDRFTAAMDDDLNTPQALAALFDLSREINRARDRGRDIEEAQATLRELAGVLGLTLQAPSAVPQDAAPFVALITAIRGGSPVSAQGSDAGVAIGELVAMRTEYRANKQWDLADRVRNGLKELGIELKDGPEGTTWEMK